MSSPSEASAMCLQHPGRNFYNTGCSQQFIAIVLGVGRYLGDWGCDCPQNTECFTPWLFMLLLFKTGKMRLLFFLIAARKTQLSPHVCTLSSSPSSILCSPYQGKGRALISAFCSSSPSGTEWKQTERKNNQLRTFSCLCKLCVTLIIGRKKMQIWKSLWIPPFFLQSCKCYSCIHRGLSFLIQLYTKIKASVVLVGD